VPEAHLAIANTLPEKETIENGWKTITFRKTKPLPSYLLAIATGPLETVEIPNLGVPARVVTVKGQSQLAAAAVEMTGPILRALEAYFGGPYPYDKLDLLAVPEYWAGAMENPGAITYSDNILLLDPQTTTLAEKRRLARVTAHELAHMWFGDLVTMTWWDDLWLNESFADWMGDKITHQVYPEFNWDLTALEGTLAVMSEDARPSTSPIRRPMESTDNLFENVGLAYEKGKAVLGMFERWVGPETFRRGVLAYLEAHAWGNATADDLWRALDKASGKKLSEAMAGFIEQPGFPLVEVTSVSGSKVTLAQHRFRVLGVEQEDMAWQIPVGLKYGRGTEVKTETVLLDMSEKTFDLGVDAEWVMPNAGSEGYYRWAVPPRMLDAISSRALQALNPRERIGLVSNSGALMTAGALGGDDYLRTLNALAVDPEPLVLGSLLDALEGVKMAMIPPEEETAFAAFVRRTFGPALVPVVIRLAAHDGDRTLYEDYRKRAENAANPGLRQQFLGALGSFRDPELRAATLRYSAESSIRPNEIFAVTGGIMETEAGREALYRWITGNYDAITGRLPQEFASFLPFIASGCSSDRLAAARVFFSEPEHQAPGIERQMAKVSDQVTECVDLREREGAAVARYLEAFSERP
jgi:alanyl aminopeptidase